MICASPNGDPYNIHNGYKVVLAAHRRAQFDPFRRGARIVFEYNGAEYVTTLGQCHFVQWARTHGVLKYAKDNLLIIEGDMSRRLTSQRGKKMIKKRSLITTASPYFCNVLTAPSLVSFNLADTEI